MASHADYETFAVGMGKEFEIVLHNQYHLGQQICRDGFGLVYSGTNLVSEERVSVKLECVVHGHGKLESEANHYKILAGGTGIPRVLWSGIESGCHVLILDFLGPSLQDLLDHCEGRFSLKTVLLLADQLLTRIEYIHSKSLIHRGIKPDNLLMGIYRQSDMVYITDIGLAGYYSADCWELDEGMRQFASINFHNYTEQFPKDDLESLGYIFVYFLRGSLPWQGLGIAKGEDASKLIGEMKSEISAVELCKDLPTEFETYISYVRSLPTSANPNYQDLRSLFRNLSTRYSITYDNIFDWSVKKYIEGHGAPGRKRRRIG